jgi:hypothetical protein
MTEIVREVSLWPGISTGDHKFGGTEFRFGQREIGHVHDFGVVDIPFTVVVRDALVRAGLAARHHWLPDSGWVTIPAHADSERAIRLLRLSFLKAELRSADSNAVRNAEIELQTFDLGDEMNGLVRQWRHQAANFADQTERSTS